MGNLAKRMAKKPLLWAVVMAYLSALVLDVSLRKDIPPKMEPHLYRPVTPSGQFLAAFAFGLQELAADFLWLTMNHHYLEQHFAKMIPYLRTITWIDPHFLKAYRLGAWNFIYNMTVEADSLFQKEMYKRAGIALLEQGIQNNPDSYELYFELGWTYYQKLRQYDLAIKYFSLARKYERPPYVDRMLAHAYEKNGQLLEAWKLWRELLKDKGQKNFRDDIKKNIDRLEKRL